MASCWRGVGVLLGTCLPSHPPDPTHPSTTTAAYASPTPGVGAPPSPLHPPPSATSASIRTHSGSSPSRSGSGSRHHHHHHHHHHHQQQTPQSQQSSAASATEGPGARYLVVRPATATPPSPRRRHHSRTHLTTNVSGQTTTTPASNGRGSEGRNGRGALDLERMPPILMLSQALNLPPPPPHLASLIYANGFKCPICSKLVLPDDLECHLVICLTKPRISYNEDVLTEDKGECVICLEDLCQGDTIARLPCLCIYHKSCIDEWFQVNRSCPEHPYD